MSQEFLENGPIRSKNVGHTEKKFFRFQKWCYSCWRLLKTFLQYGQVKFKTQDHEKIHNLHINENGRTRNTVENTDTVINELKKLFLEIKETETTPTKINEMMIGTLPFF